MSSQWLRLDLSEKRKPTSSMEGHSMHPIQIPQEWSDSGLLTFEEFCELMHIPQRTVRDWRRRGVGPRWARLDGCGRIYITVAETRRFLASATSSRTVGYPHG